MNHEARSTPYVRHGVLVPDLGDDLLRPLRLLAALLADLRAWSAAREYGCSGLPGIVVECGTLLSVRRLIYLLEPTQGSSRQMPDVYGPDGAEAHTVLTPVELPGPDVGALSLAVRVLGRPVLPWPASDLLTLYAGIDLPEAVPARASDLVAELAALAGVLELPATPATRSLADVLAAVRRGGEPAVLTAEAEAAYREAIHRINVLWIASSHGHRSLS